ncbi:MAG: Holliday junction resolvase RuvX [Planctomycetota bacterium]|nr:Holliday junction resolvase RuvX [Planctomycetota bacterium]
MSRIMALDIGKRRTGIAISDSLGIAITPLETIHHRGFEQLVCAVLKLVEKYKVGKVVVGLPRRTDGKKGEMEQFVDRVVEILREKKILVDTIDEWFSTKEALKLLDRKQRRIKGTLDSKAAQIILSTYLLREKNG